MLASPKLALEVLLLALLFPLLAFSAERLAPIVVHARALDAAAEAPTTVSVVEGATWESHGERIEAALARVPGLAFSAAGGPGQTRSLFLRGAKAEHVLVLVDGLPVNDPLSPSRAFDFSQLPLGSVDRIEVLKGPQSVLYGSDALGGVVQFFTKPSGTRLKVEGGSYGTIRASGAAAGFFAGFEQSRGFSSADEAYGNQERDGHRAFNLGGSRTFSISESSSVRVQSTYQQARTDTDLSGGPGGDSPGTRTRNQQLAARAEALVLGGGGRQWVSALSLFSRRRHDNTVGPNHFRAELLKAETQGSLPWGTHESTLGLDFTREQGRSSQLTGRPAFHAGAAYWQHQWRPGRWQILGGGRLDAHSEHPTAGTGRLAAAYWLWPQRLRAKANFGTGFKAPSLYQTHSVYGSRALSSERSSGGELGLSLNHQGWQGELVAFTTSYRNLIDFDPARSRYFNQGRAHTRGLEAALEKTVGRFTWRNAFTYLRARDPATGRDLARRPRYSNYAELEYTQIGRWGAALGLRYVGRRFDTNPVTFAPQTMPGFATTGINGFYFLKKDFRLTARIENLLNRRYQETAGYGTPRLSAYAGLEVSL